MDRRHVGMRTNLAGFARTPDILTANAVVFGRKAVDDLHRRKMERETFQPA